MQKEIIIRIDKQGSMKIDVQNCTGNECTKITAPLEKLLGGVASRTEKPELHLGIEQAQQVHAG